MKTALLLLVILHGLIHAMGFVKAFDFMDIKALTSPISKTAGTIWLITSLLFLIFSGLFYLNHRLTGIVGLVAIILSQILIIYFWKDAKWGTLANIIILVPVLCLFGTSLFKNLVAKEQAEILTKVSVGSTEIFSNDEISNLPEPVKRWLERSGAIGRAKNMNGKVVQKASMKMKPDQEEWYAASALQYTTVSEPAFIWTVDLKMNDLLWIKGRDKFQDGKGEMLIKLNSIINVVNAAGEKINEGAIQRLLGELVWFPALTVSPYVQWEGIDENSARATIDYKGTSGSGVFYFNEKGDFTKYVALRYQGNEPDAKRKEWILTVDEYRVFEDIKVPSKMKATWMLDTGAWTWLELEIVDIEYDVTL